VVTSPRFKHDCTGQNCCRFVGRTRVYDVYLYNASDVDGPGVLLRYGDDGPDYTSWPAMRYARLVAEGDSDVFHAVQLVESN
jgi:hypothetical protein